MLCTLPNWVLCFFVLGAGPQRRFWPEHGSWWMLRRRMASLRCIWLPSTTTAMWPRSSSRRWAEDVFICVNCCVLIFFFTHLITNSLKSLIFCDSLLLEKKNQHFSPPPPNSSNTGTMRHQHPQQPEPDAAAAGGDAGPHRLGATAGGGGRRRQHGGRGRWHGHACGPPPPTAGQRHAQPHCGNQQHRGQQRGLLLHIALLQGESDRGGGMLMNCFVFWNLFLIFHFFWPKEMRLWQYGCLHLQATANSIHFVYSVRISSLIFIDYLHYL